MTHPFENRATYGMTDSRRYSKIIFHVFCFKIYDITLLKFASLNLPFNEDF